MTPHFNGGTDAVGRRWISRRGDYLHYAVHRHFGCRHPSSIRRAG